MFYVESNTNSDVLKQVPVAETQEIVITGLPQMYEGPSFSKILTLSKIGDNVWLTTIYEASGLVAKILVLMSYTGDWKAIVAVIQGSITVSLIVCVKVIDG